MLIKTSPKPNDKMPTNFTSSKREEIIIVFF